MARANRTGQVTSIIIAAGVQINQAAVEIDHGLTGGGAGAAVIDANHVMPDAGTQQGLRDARAGWATSDVGNLEAQFTLVAVEI